MTCAIQNKYFFDIFDFPEIGFSQESDTLKNFFTKQIDEFTNSESIGQPIHNLLINLQNIYNECSQHDWDGYGAEPVAQSTYIEAESLIHKLTLLNFPIPEIVIEPTGDIALEWHKSEKSIFVISVNGKKTIVYAGLFGSNSINGTEYFGNILPEVILSCLKRLYTP